MARHNDDDDDDDDDDDRNIYLRNDTYGIRSVGILFAHHDYDDDDDDDDDDYRGDLESEMKVSRSTVKMCPSRTRTQDNVLSFFLWSTSIFSTFQDLSIPYLHLIYRVGCKIGNVL